MVSWLNSHKHQKCIKTKQMFKKLLSNLPYNPSLIGEVSFYANALKPKRAYDAWDYFLWY